VVDKAAELLVTQKLLEQILKAPGNLIAMETAHVRLPPVLSTKESMRMDEPAGRTKVLAQIAVCRDAIDAIDAQLVALLSSRAQNVVEIGRLKGLLQMEIYQPAREEAVLRHVRSVNPGPLDGDAIARLFERIIDEARRLERAMAERGHQ